MDVLEALKYFRKKKNCSERCFTKKGNKPIEESKLVKPS